MIPSLKIISLIRLLLFIWILEIRASDVDTNHIDSSTETNSNLNSVLVDLGKMLVDACPPLECTGKNCVLATERNGCTVCACPIGSPSRGCDPMPFVLWHRLMTDGCPSTSIPNQSKPAQRVTRYFRRINRFEHSDECESYVFPYCPDLDYNLWRSPRSKVECQQYCFSNKPSQDSNLAAGRKTQRRQLF